VATGVESDSRTEGEIMSIEAMKQAVRVMGLIGADLICEVAHHEKKDRHELGEPCPVKQRFHEAFQTLRAAIEQAEQGQWVGLTDEEIFKVENAVPDEVIGDSNWCVYFAKAIEAKLKEKNETT
jgi:hypothetical protein